MKALFPLALLAASEVAAEEVEATAEAFRSGSVSTYQRFTYGKFVARIKNPNKKGTVASFFSYWDGPGFYPGGWNQLAFEVAPSVEQGPVSMAVVYGDGRDQVLMDHDEAHDYDPSDGWHTYSMEWTPDYISFEVDGVEMKHLEAEWSDAVKFQNKAQALRLNYWTPTDNVRGTGLEPSDMPWLLLFDYVEVYSYDQPNNQFRRLWRDDFDNFDHGRWHRATGGFEANSSTFYPENVYTRNGYLHLKMEPEKPVTQSYSPEPERSYPEGELTRHQLSHYKDEGQMEDGIDENSYYDDYDSEDLYGYEDYYDEEVGFDDYHMDYDQRDMYFEEDQLENKQPKAGRQQKQKRGKMQRQQPMPPPPVPQSEQFPTMHSEQPFMGGSQAPVRSSYQGGGQPQLQPQTPSPGGAAFQGQQGDTRGRIMPSAYQRDYQGAPTGPQQQPMSAQPVQYPTMGASQTTQRYDEAQPGVATVSPQMMRGYKKQKKLKKGKGYQSYGYQPFMQETQRTTSYDTGKQAAQSPQQPQHLQQPQQPEHPQQPMHSQQPLHPQQTQHPMQPQQPQQPQHPQQRQQAQKQPHFTSIPYFEPIPQQPIEYKPTQLKPAHIPQPAKVEATVGPHAQYGYVHSEDVFPVAQHRNPQGAVQSFLQMPRLDRQKRHEEETYAQPRPHPKKPAPASQPIIKATVTPKTVGKTDPKPRQYLAPKIIDPKQPVQQPKPQPKSQPQPQPQLQPPQQPVAQTPPVIKDVIDDEDDRFDFAEGEFRIMEFPDFEPHHQQEFYEEPAQMQMQYSSEPIQLQPGQGPQVAYYMVPSMQYVQAQPYAIGLMSAYQNDNTPSMHGGEHEAPLHHEATEAHQETPVAHHGKPEPKTPAEKPKAKKQPIEEPKPKPDPAPEADPVPTPPPAQVQPHPTHVDEPHHEEIPYQEHLLMDMPPQKGHVVSGEHSDEDSEKEGHHAEPEYEIIQQQKPAQPTKPATPPTPPKPKTQPVVELALPQEPSKPGQPSQPAQPSKPAQPVKPVQPVTPSPQPAQQPAPVPPHPEYAFPDPYHHGHDDHDEHHKDKHHKHDSDHGHHDYLADAHRPTAATQEPYVPVHYREGYAVAEQDEHPVHHLPMYEHLDLSHDDDHDDHHHKHSKHHDKHDDSDSDHHEKVHYVLQPPEPAPMHHTVELVEHHDPVTSHHGEDYSHVEQLAAPAAVYATAPPAIQSYEHAIQPRHRSFERAPESDDEHEDHTEYLVKRSPYTGDPYYSVHDRGHSTYHQLVPTAVQHDYDLHFADCSHASHDSEMYMHDRHLSHIRDQPNEVIPPSKTPYKLSKQEQKVEKKLQKEIAKEEKHAEKAEEQQKQEYMVKRFEQSDKEFVATVGHREIHAKEVIDKDHQLHSHEKPHHGDAHHGPFDIDLENLDLELKKELKQKLKQEKHDAKEAKKHHKKDKKHLHEVLPPVEHHEDHQHLEPLPEHVRQPGGEITPFEHAHEQHVKDLTAQVECHIHGHCEEPHHEIETHEVVVQPISVPVPEHHEKVTLFETEQKQHVKDLLAEVEHLQEEITHAETHLEGREILTEHVDTPVVVKEVYKPQLDHGYDEKHDIELTHMHDHAIEEALREDEPSLHHTTHEDFPFLEHHLSIKEPEHVVYQPVHVVEAEHHVYHSEPVIEHIIGEPRFQTPVIEQHIVHIDEPILEQHWEPHLEQHFHHADEHIDYSHFDISRHHDDLHDHDHDHDYSLHDHAHGFDHLLDPPHFEMKHHKDKHHKDKHHEDKHHEDHHLKESKHHDHHDEKVHHDHHDEKAHHDHHSDDHSDDDHHEPVHLEGHMWTDHHEKSHFSKHFHKMSEEEKVQSRDRALHFQEKIERIEDHKHIIADDEPRRHHLDDQFFLYKQHKDEPIVEEVHEVVVEEPVVYSSDEEPEYHFQTYYSDSDEFSDYDRYERAQSESDSDATQYYDAWAPDFEGLERQYDSHVEEHHSEPSHAEEIDDHVEKAVNFRPHLHAKAKAEGQATFEKSDEEKYREAHKLQARQKRDSFFINQEKEKSDEHEVVRQEHHVRDEIPHLGLSPKQEFNSGKGKPQKDKKDDSLKEDKEKDLRKKPVFALHGILHGVGEDHLDPKAYHHFLQ